MSPGEWQVWSWAASGCSRRSLFVRSLYVFKALLIISWKLEDEDEEEEEAAAG
jgi:hypothetical protein